MDVDGEQGKDSPYILAREANHRIANQLALLTGAVQLKVDALKRGPQQLSREQAADLLRAVSAKIVAIGSLHRRLASTDDAPVDLGHFLAASEAELVSTLSNDGCVHVVEALSADCHVTAEQASILCLVLSEITVNALKYAHPAGEQVTLQLSCARRNGTIVVEVADDGVGLPDGFKEETHGGVGFKLIRNLLRQIGAGLELQSSPHGLCFRITLESA